MLCLRDWRVSAGPLVTALTVLLLTVACATTDEGIAAQDRGSDQASAEPMPPEEPVQLAAPAATQELLPPGEDATLLEKIRLEHWSGDLDGMIERRYIRALVVYSKTFFFADGAELRGVTYEALREFETVLNKKINIAPAKVTVVFVPVSRDELLPALADGRGDLAAANLTITPERSKLVDFSNAALDNVNEIVVTGPAAPQLANLDDLSGQEVFVRASSSYYESLLRLNDSLKERGKPPVNVRPADENLEDEDLLEMVNAGLIGITVTDDHKGKLWEQVFDDITLHSDIAVNTGGHVAWAFRKNSPQLKATVDDFIKDHRAGTAFGNTILRRYLRTTKWVKNAATQEEMKKFRATVDYFKKYADQYDFDWLLLAAQGYQESRLDQDVKSPVGAVGIMQVLPSTANGHPVNIPDIQDADNNIHAGTKLLRFIVDHYYKDEPMDRINKGLFALASYNAGPNKIARLRKEAAKQGLDPNKWFRNVELVVAKRIGRETIQYVSNIYKYYIAFKLIVERQATREAASAQKKS